MAGFLGVPDVVWSGLIGSTIAFVGVALSNRSNTERLERQLRHDAHEKATERRADVRRSAYLDFVEHFAAANIYIGGMSNIEHVDGQNVSDGLKLFHSATAKSQLIAGIETADAISRMVAEHTKFFLKAIAKLAPIQTLRANIKVQSEIYETARADMQRILSAMSAFNEAGKTDRTVFAALNMSFEHQKAIADAATAKRSALYDEVNELHRDYLDFVTTTAGSIMRASAPVMAAMRRELEIDGYAVDFEKRYLQRLAQMEAEVQAAAADFKADMLNATSALPDGEATAHNL